MTEIWRVVVWMIAEAEAAHWRKQREACHCLLCWPPGSRVALEIYA